jgi:hypothetical protein
MDDLKTLVDLHKNTPKGSVLITKLESAVSVILAASKREATARARKAEAEMRLAEERSPRGGRSAQSDRTDPPARDGYEGWGLDEPAEPAAAAAAEPEEAESVATEQEVPEEASEASVATTAPRKRKRKPPKAHVTQSHCQREKPSHFSALQHFENSFGVSLSSGQVKDLRARIQKMAG